MIVNNEDYYYLPGVAKAIKTLLGRDDLKKFDVPEVLAGLGYDYDANTIPYQEHGKTISLYRKSSIPELLNLPGNRYKANQLIAKINGRNKGMNVFVSSPNVGRHRPNRKSFVTECYGNNKEFFRALLESNDIEPFNIVNVYVNKKDDNDFVIYDGRFYFSVVGEDVQALVDKDTKRRIEYVIEKLKKAYANHNLQANITERNGKIVIEVDKWGSAYNSDVYNWMANKGFRKDYKLSHEYKQIYYITDAGMCNDMPEILDNFNDVTNPILKCGSYLPNDVLIKNLKKMYLHLSYKNEIFKIGRRTDIAGGAVIPCIRLLGELREDYPPTDSELVGFRYDRRLYDQYVIGWGVVPGVYRLDCYGRSATMIAWTDKNAGSLRQRGYVFYNDDESIDPSLRKYIKMI